MKIKGLEIYCATATKDVLVDFLLAEGYEDFYYFPCSHYGSGAFLVSAEEQVSARRQFGIFRLFLSGEEASRVASALREGIPDKTIKIVAYDVNEM